MLKKPETEQTISLRCPLELHRKIKAKAAGEGVKIKFIAIQLFKYWLKNGLPSK